MTNTRVVITGVGVVAPNGHGVDRYTQALRTSQSGVRRIEALAQLGFRCQVGAIPKELDELRAYLVGPDAQTAGSNGLFAAAAAVDCWADAGVARAAPGDERGDWDTGGVLGALGGNAENFAEWVTPQVRAGNVRRLGSAALVEAMSSSLGMRISGLLALGGRIATTSMACASGADAIVEAFNLVRAGRLTRVLGGSADSGSPYVWGPLDAVRLLSAKYNDAPEKASRPLSASSGGIVPGGGAAVMLFESLASATARQARIYAEVLGGHVNSGGQRSGGGLTTANPEGIVRCIRAALADAGVSGSEIDLVNGHLTGTVGDPVEMRALTQALDRPPAGLPLVQATKSLIGHCLGAAGSLESVATVLQLHHGFLHASVNCEDLRPDLVQYQDCIVREVREQRVRLALKLSLGFGDVNGCVVFKCWDQGAK